MKHHVICLFQEPEKAETAEPAKEEPKPEAKAKNRSNRGGREPWVNVEVVLC